MIVAAIINTIAVLVLAGVVFRLAVAPKSTERPLDALLRDRLREQVILTLKTGEAFRGGLFDADDRSLILRNASAVTEAGGRHVPVDGELLVARADVEYIQRVGRGDG